MTGSISGKLCRLAIVKYNGIRVKTVISLVKNIADTIDKIVKIAVNLLVLLTNYGCHNDHKLILRPTTD